MYFNQYQIESSATEKYPDDAKIVANTIGLTAEAGELTGIIEKKIRRTGKAVLTIRDFTPEEIEHIISEAGDVLFHLARLCAAFNLDLEAVAIRNRLKLSNRQATGTIHNHQDH